MSARAEMLVGGKSLGTKEFRREPIVGDLIEHAPGQFVCVDSVCHCLVRGKYQIHCTEKKSTKPETPQPARRSSSSRDVPDENPPTRGKRSDT